MPKPWYTIKAAADGSEYAEISILDVISSWYGVDARSFMAEFKALKAPKVKLYINSPGGDVMQAITIFNGMRATGKYIEAHVLGIAASAASYIAMAADKVFMPRNTMMLPHKPMTALGGNADELRDAADTLDKVESLLIPAYMNRWKGTEDELKALLAEDRLLTAQECLDYGFADEVVAEINATAEFDVETLPPEARKVFEAVQQRSEPTDPPTPAALLSDGIATMVDSAGLAEFKAVIVADPEAVSLEAATTIINRAREIVALAKHSGMPEIAAAAIGTRKTVQEVRAQIAAVLAKRDERLHVDNTPQLQSDPQPRKPSFDSPSALWSEIHEVKKRSYA